MALFWGSANWSLRCFMWEILWKNLVFKDPWWFFLKKWSCSKRIPLFCTFNFLSWSLTAFRVCIGNNLVSFAENFQNLLKFEGFVLRLSELILTVFFVRNSVGQIGLERHLMVFGTELWNYLVRPLRLLRSSFLHEFWLKLLKEVQFQRI